VTATLEAPASAGPASADDDVTEPPQPARPVPAALAPWRDPHPWVDWLVTALVTLLAAVTRFWAVGYPHGKSFDEVYYATEAQELLRYGYEDNRGYMFIVHPPLGKWLIAVTSQLWGDSSVGWRIAPAVAGIVSVILVTRITRRMLRSNLFGAIAGLLLALDGLSLVLSRTALLDIFLQTFVLAGFGALVVDRDTMRARLAALIADGAELSAGAPTLGPRPWRLAGGILLGGAAAYYLAKVVKTIVPRGRPAELLPDVHIRGAAAAGRGYISGHAAVVTLIATLAWPYLGRRTRIVVVVVVVAVGLARVYVSAHLPLDVVGGAALGLGIAGLVRLITGRPG
jgi:membrane-associated phospholipid phosphatase